MQISPVRRLAVLAVLGCMWLIPGSLTAGAEPVGVWTRSADVVHGGWANDESRLADKGASRVVRLVTFDTTVGKITVRLLRADAPKTVANFLRYVRAGRYRGTFFQRSVKHFVIQAGGYVVRRGEVDTVETYAPVANEYKVPNLQGTLAMAKPSNAPNGATSQFFFNEADNARTLSRQDGGFTVFGRIADRASLRVLAKLEQSRIVDTGTAFPMLPVVDYPHGSQPSVKNLVYIDAIHLQS